MAKKKSRKKKGRKPTTAAKKAYYANIVKSYKRLKPIMKKYHPELV